MNTISKNEIEKSKIAKKAFINICLVWGLSKQQQQKLLNIKSSQIFEEDK